MQSEQKVTFLATFPPIQSAIKFGNDGMRVQLDIPETEIGNAIEMVAWRGKRLVVTIEPDPNGDNVTGG